MTARVNPKPLLCRNRIAPSVHSFVHQRDDRTCRMLNRIDMQGFAVTIGACVDIIQHRQNARCHLKFVQSIDNFSQSDGFFRTILFNVRIF